MAQLGERRRWSFHCYMIEVCAAGIGALVAGASSTGGTGTIRRRWNERSVSCWTSFDTQGEAAARDPERFCARFNQPIEALLVPNSDLP
jgi:hypothetical protein